jgi:hypothetical protein
MKSYEQEHQLMRRKVWCDAWSSTANANDCKSTKTATAYADAALEAFDERFPPLQDASADGDKA